MGQAAELGHQQNEAQGAQTEEQRLACHGQHQTHGEHGGHSTPDCESEKQFHCEGMVVNCRRTASPHIQDGPRRLRRFTVRKPLGQLIHLRLF